MAAVCRSHGDGRRFGGWLVVLALGYAVFHHVGTLFAGLGDVGDTETRWADWIDLLDAVRRDRCGGGCAARGAGQPRARGPSSGSRRVLYTQGQGIHLAANSVGNAVPGDHSRRTSGTSTSATTSGTSASA